MLVTEYDMHNNAIHYVEPFYGEGEVVTQYLECGILHFASMPAALVRCSNGDYHYIHGYDYELEAISEVDPDFEYWWIHISSKWWED